MNENDSGRIYHIIRDGMVRMAVRGRELKDTDIVESVDEPDSRAQLEADVHRWLTSHVAVSVYTKDVESEVCKWLDRQAAITKRETLHDNPKCSGRSTCAVSSTCTANRPISESADRETHDTAGIGASKDEIRDFDVWSVAYEIYCAGGYVDNGNEPNPPTDGIRELLDRQAAITERECANARVNFAERIEFVNRIEELKVSRRRQAETIRKLSNENDELKSKLNYLEGHGVEIVDAVAGGYEVYNEWHRIADELQAKLDKARNEREMYRECFGKSVDKADEIRAIMAGMGMK